MATTCLLENVLGIYRTITVPNLQSIIIGRSAATRIKDKKCSKQQVELFANYEKYSIVAKQIGQNDSGFQNKAIGLGKEVILHHESILEVLIGNYQYKVKFSPIPKADSPSKDNFYCSKMPNRNHASNVTAKRTMENDDIFSKNKVAKRENTGSGWECFENGDLLVLNRTGIPGNTKIASYDMDGTWIITSSGRVFPKDNNDWKIIYPEVPGKLKKLEKDGFKIVLFTNQAGVAKGKNTVEGIQTKISRVISSMGVNAQAFISVGSKKFRKPVTGMWDFFVEKCNEGVSVDKSQSFYVGDAAGRPEIPKIRKKDHSIADRLFALNLELPFFTPEEHFKGHPPSKFKMPDFLPSKLDDLGPLLNPSTAKIPADSLEVIVMVGFPGSGKSFFVENHLVKCGYISMNRDTLGSWQKCVAGLESSLTDKKSVVVDNTNPDKESRKRYIEAAKKFNVPVRCFIYDVTLDHSKHNNKFRELCHSDHSKVNDMIYNMYKSKYQEPTLEEGFKEIVKVNFKPEFKNKELEKLYKLFLLEK